MRSFKKWLEDAGPVHNPITNDVRYSERGVGSKIVSTDKNKDAKGLDISPHKLFKKKKSKK